MKYSRWKIRITAVLSLLLLVLNVVLFLTREWESSYSPTSYATLYYPLDVPAIRRWVPVERNQRQLHLACARDIAEWTLTTDGKNPRTVTGMSPLFRIDTTFGEMQTYTLSPVPRDACRPVEVSIRFYPREFYGSLGMERGDVYVVRANVPCGDFQQFSIADWTDDYSYVGAEDLAEVDRILREDVGIRTGDATFTTMEKLFPYLRKKLKACRGVPKNDTRWMNPWVLYNELVAGTAKGWCTQHAQVWAFWANRAGIPTRFVFGARTEDDAISYTGHAWSESYIREQDRWAFVDLSHGQLYITNNQGHVLNSAELLHLNQHNAYDSVLARLYLDWEWEKRVGGIGTDTLVSVPFSVCNDAVRGEFIPQSILKYRRPPNVEDVRGIYTGFLRDHTFLWGNLERYLFKPQLAYSFYPTDGEHTYFIRRSLFGGFVLTGILWLFFLLTGRRSRRQKNAPQPPTS